MKRERLYLSPTNIIETAIDQNGRYYIALYKNTSRLFRDPIEMRKWIGLPIKTPSREQFDDWIKSLTEKSND